MGKSVRLALERPETARAPADVIGGNGNNSVVYTCTPRHIKLPAIQGRLTDT